MQLDLFVLVGSYYYYWYERELLFILLIRGDNGLAYIS